MNIEEMYNYILSLSHEDRINILTKKDVRDFFLTYDAHDLFVNLIYQLKDDELKYFIDSKYLDKILNSNRSIDKICVIMMSGKISVTDILLDFKAIPLIIDSTTNLHSFLYNLDYRMGQLIIDYNLLNKRDNFSILANFSGLEQVKIFNSEYITKLLNYNELSSRFLVDLDNKVINKLIRYDKFLNIFLNLIPRDINTIINNGFVIPNYLYNNKKLIDKYISLDTSIYREYVDNLIKNNYNFYEIIEKARLKQVDNKISNISNGIFIEYGEFQIHHNIYNYDYKTSYELQKCKNEYEITNYFKYRTKEQILEMIIDVFFKDVPYNFLKNLKVLLNYSKENSNYIPKNIDIYETLLNFNNMSIKEIIKFYNDNKNKNLSKKFYDDYRLARNLSYKSINDSIMKIDENCNINRFKINGVDIYELNGENFYLYVHSSNKGYWSDNDTSISISLISHNNITTINNRDIIFGFAKLKIDNIMHMYHSDAFTKFNNGTNKVQDINTPDKLIDKTTSYNEILYKEEDGFKPDYIICYDYIDNKSINLAKEMNTPIIVINSEMYKKKINGIEDYLDNCYLDGSKVTNYEILEDIKIKQL